MNGPGLMALRLALAVVFIAHGAHKLFGLFGTPAIGLGGPDATAQWFASVGLEPGLAIGMAVGAIELAGGLLLIIGWRTRVVSPLLALVSLVVAWKAYWPWGFYLNWTGIPDRGTGIELHLLLLGGLVCLWFTGGGDWSVDGVRERTAHERAAGKARLRGKV